MGGKHGGGKHGDGNGDVEQTENGAQSILANVAVGAALAVGLVVGGFKLLGSSSDEKTVKDKKTMKAPGRNYRIVRDDFEHDPASYFRDLRKSG
ncbi:Nop14, putative isoform 1 [Hibiscus syriacus]|uniref:Nop14, putative isoform 1 n=1 Tax=Hibiscus syriacus TaxID=106335 RepID=A0A6A2WS77_HIBSY|nr:Nop14, putative isoform 1 [Hibiscus syriacus]